MRVRAGIPEYVLTLSLAVSSCACVARVGDGSQRAGGNEVSALSITTSSMPAGTLGTAYSASLAATGGASPYTWSVSSGSLPDGFSLASSGAISGTPTATGSSSFTVRVADAASATATRTLSITVGPAGPSVWLAVLPGSASVAPGGTRDFTVRLRGTANTAVTWSVAETGGGTVNAGHYTAPTSTGTFHVVATSVANPSKRATATVVVSTLSVATSSVQPGTVGSPYSATLAAAGGTPPYHWSVTSGALPGGLALAASTGTLSGTPTVAGSSSLTVRLTDAASGAAARDLSIAIAASSGGYVQPDPVSGDVTVAIDSRSTSPISPYVFGVNGKYSMEQAGQQPWAPGTWSPRVALSRIGGNTLSSIDWRTGYTNFTDDYCFWNNDTYADTSNAFGGPTVAGSSFQRWADPSFQDDTAFLWTVPLLPYVAADANHVQACSDTGAARSLMSLDWNNPFREVATDRHQLDFLPADRTRVHEWLARNPNGPTATPAMTGAGYADDFIRWLTAHHPGQSTARGQRVMVALDNEPDNWCWDSGAKHGWALGWARNDPNTHYPEYTVELGHDHFIDRTVEVATAVKDVDPDIDVFGGVFMGYWGLYALGNMSEPGAHEGHGVDARFMRWPQGAAQAGVTFPFLEMWLDRLNGESIARGRRLVDVLDTHYYHDAYTRDGRDSAGNEADSDANMLHSRMQAPRAFWDPTYHSNSEIEWKGGLWGMNGTQTSLQAGGVASNWVNRLKATLAKYPSGPQKLAFTEYQLGRPGDISGAIAQADILGVFAREGVYAATMWPMTQAGAAGYGNSMARAYAGYSAAFKAWVDYDGAGSGSGDTYVQTVVNDSNRPADPNRPDISPGQTLERITAYATVDAADPDRMVIIVMNKTLSGSLNVGFRVTHTLSFGTAAIYRVTGDNGLSASITGPTRQADVSITGANAFNVTLPAQSISVITLAP